MYDEENGEPIIFTSVYLKGTTFGTATDVNGYYNITQIKPGSYVLMVTYIGYDTLKVPVDVTTGGMLTVLEHIAQYDSDESVGG